MVKRKNVRKSQRLLTAGRVCPPHPAPAIAASPPASPQPSTTTGKGRHMQENNVKAVYEALNNNIGREGLNRFVSTLGFQCFSEEKFASIANFLYEEMDTIYPRLMEQVISGVKKHYKKADILPDETTGLLDITVSFDGSRMTRGHTSHICVGFAVEEDTRFVVDCEVISNLCQVCTTRENKGLPATPEWKASHAPFCNKNYTGAASSMETEAVRRIWRRSTQLGLRYTSFVGDGDSSNYLTIQQLDPYDVPVQKSTGKARHSESLHSKLWMKVDKFAELRRVKFMCQVVVLEHNLGFEAAYFPRHLGFSMTAMKTDNLEFLQKECERSNTKKIVRRRTKEQDDEADYSDGDF